MIDQEDLAYVLFAIMVWVPAVLAVFPPQARGRYVFFGVQFTRVDAVLVFFLLVLGAFAGVAAYRTWQYVEAIDDTTPTAARGREEQD